MQIAEGVECDLANMTFEELPLSFQQINLISARQACDIIDAAIVAGTALDRTFIERAAEKLHVAWRKQDFRRTQGLAKKGYSPGVHVPCVTLWEPEQRCAHVAPCSPASSRRRRRLRSKPIHRPFAAFPPRAPLLPSPSVLSVLFPPGMTRSRKLRRTRTDTLSTWAFARSTTFG